MKKIFLVFLVSGYIFASSININGKAIDTQFQNMNLAKVIYKNSIDLNKLSKVFIQVLNKNNRPSKRYILQLSKDIKSKANNINIMVDKIVVNKKTLGKNLELSRQNILSTQQNILNIISTTNKNSIGLQENLHSINYILEEIIEKNKINQDISKAKNIDALVDKIGSVSPKYRYKYMNAIKKIILAKKKTERKEKINKILKNIKINKQTQQIQKEKSNMNISKNKKIKTSNGTENKTYDNVKEGNF